MTLKHILFTGIATGMVLFTATGCGDKKGETTSLEGNYFAEESTLPFGAPDFSKIKVGDYLPAVKAGIEQQRAEIQAIVDNTEAPTFENVIVAYQKSGHLLQRASAAFFAVAGADATKEIEDIEAEMMPLLTAWSDEVAFNQAFFEKIKAVYDNEYATLQGEDKKLLEELYKSFTRRGAALPDDQKKELEKINARIAVLEQQFGNTLPEAVRNSLILVTDTAELAGLSEADKAQLKSEAEAAGVDAPYAITLINTTQQPIMASLDNRALREKVYNASIHRTDETSKYNTYPIVVELAELRAQKAQILGFPNYAAYAVADNMAKSPENLATFLENLAAAYVPKAQAEMKEIEEFARKTEGSDFTLQPWDVAYYSAKMKQEKFNFSDDDVKPYFQVDSVLENGVFYAANRVYGLSFEERFDLPAYHKDMRVFTVKDADGSEIALLYFDPFRRPTKRGGAWMSSFQDQNTLLDQKPIIYNVLNITKSPDGQPSFCSWDDVTTMFHEFGHTLHGLLSNVKYPLLSGTAVPSDFVEFPSQFNEYFATVPEVFNNYAKHFETGEPMPQALKENMLNSVKYLPTYALGENLAATNLDLQWHLRPAGNPVKAEEAGTFETAALKRVGLDLAQIPPRYRTSYFNHVWGGGYAAGYYSYLFSETLSANAGLIFDQKGSLNPEVGKSLRDNVLSRGNTVDLNEAFAAFSGMQTPDPGAILKTRGITE